MKKREKEKILCDIKRKSIDLLRMHDYNCAQIVIDVNAAVSRADIKVVKTQTLEGRVITITEVL